jgi:hypothetical protein
MGVPASREAHVRLFVNNAYAGLYTVVEAVDQAFLRRSFGEDEGYLYDYDYPADSVPYYFEYRGDNPALYVPGPFNPETHESNPRPEVIERLIYTINMTDSASFRSAIAEFVDVNAFIRYVAVEAFLAEQDGFLGDWGMNNFYLYRPKELNQFRIIAWDKSQAFVFGPTASVWHNITDVAAPNRNRLIARLLEYPDLRTLYLDALVEAAQSAGDVAPPDTRSWLEREIDFEAAQIRDAVFADDKKPFSNAEFEQAVESLRAFARTRPAFVTAEVASSRAASVRGRRTR